MRLRVARRVAGEGKCIATYIKFLEDLGCGEQAGRLALLVDLEDDGGKTIAGLRDRGYTVTIDGVKAIS